MTVGEQPLAPKGRSLVKFSKKKKGQSGTETFFVGHKEKSLICEIMWVISERKRVRALAKEESLKESGGDLFLPVY